MRKIVGLSGVKGAGKDTAAATLVAKHNFVRIAFADKLYEECALAFGVTLTLLGARETKEVPLLALALVNCTVPEYVDCVAYALNGMRGDRIVPLSQAQLEEPRSPRFIMQYWGTEFRRQGVPGVHAGNDSYWLDIVRAVIEKNPTTSYVVTDVRFLNELNLVRQLGGVACRVSRPELEAKEALSRAQHGTAAHASETALFGATFDQVFLNEEGVFGALEASVLQFVASLDSVSV